MNREITNELELAVKKKRKNKIRTIIILVICIIIVLLLLLFRCEILRILNFEIFGCSSDVSPTPTNSIKLDEGAGEWDGNKQTNFAENNEEYITIPGYTTVVVNEANQSIQLYNPPENTVYFQYTVSDKNGTVLFNTDAIGAGSSIRWNVFESLDKGEHEVTIKISTVDIDTLVNCNGSSQKVKVIVQ